VLLYLLLNLVRIKRVEQEIERDEKCEKQDGGS